MNNKQYQEMLKQNILYMCLRCQSNTFRFFDQPKSDVSIISSGFNNVRFSSDTNIFLDHLVSINSKYHDINDFNKFNINKNSSLATLHLNIASLTKHFEDLQNFLFLLKHSFDIIGISEHKITKGSKNSAFNLPGYTFCFNETETSHGGTGFFVPKNLSHKLRPDLLINENGRLKSTAIEWIFPNKKILSVVPFIISILV